MKSNYKRQQELKRQRKAVQDKFGATKPSTHPSQKPMRVVSIDNNTIVLAPATVTTMQIRSNGK